MENKKLKYYLQHGYRGSISGLLAILWPNFINNYAAIKTLSLIKTTSDTQNSNQTVSLESFTWKNTHAENIKIILNEYHLESLYATIVHGSISTNEIVNYSDFDGILIIDESKINSVSELKLLRQLIIRTELEMMKMDALQHHGWQIILKSEMSNYYDSTFPLLLMRKGKSLFHEHSTINFYVNPENQNYKIGFSNLKISILKKIASGELQNNFYTFKNFISELLLIPALYYQALNNEPIFKKDSFEWIENNLEKKYYSIFVDLSELRANWKQGEVDESKERLANKLKLLKIVSKQFRTKLPARYKEWLNPIRKEMLLQTLDEMTNKIDLKN